MISSKITSKGQVTIPKIVREFLNVDVSDNIEFILTEEGKVLVTGKRNSATDLFGMLKHRNTGGPVSIEKMEAAIRERRLKRNME